MSSLVKLIKFLMSFVKPPVNFLSRFASIFSIITDNSSLLISTQTYTFAKRNPLKCKFWDLRVKTRQIPQVIFKAKVSFSSKFPLFYSVMTHSIKVQLFRIATARIKIHHTSRITFGTKSQFFFKSELPLSVSWDITLLFLFIKNLYSLDKRNASKCNFSDFRLLAWKLIKFLCNFSSHESVFL